MTAVTILPGWAEVADDDEQHHEPTQKYAVLQQIAQEARPFGTKGDLLCRVDKLLRWIFTLFHLRVSIPFPIETNFKFE